MYHQANFMLQSTLSRRAIRSARTSTSSCSLRSTRLSRLRSSVRAGFAVGPRRPAGGAGVHGVRRQPGVGQVAGPSNRGVTFISPNGRFDLSNYGDVSVDPAAAVRRRLAEAAEAALQSDSFRIDASDLMPQEIGGSTCRRRPRRLLAGDDRLGRRDTHHRRRSFADIDAESGLLARKRKAGFRRPPEVVLVQALKRPDSTRNVRSPRPTSSC